MDSAGLAQAVTNYWNEMYHDHEEGRAEHSPLPVISVAGIHQRIKRALTSCTARAWLLKLGWNWKEVKKGVYQDSHEKADVTTYRQEVFLPRIERLQSQMMEWDQDLNVIDKSYELGSRPLVFITHDECTFNSNDGRKKIWIHENQAPIRKKGRGQGLHVSDFLTPVGRLDSGKVCETLKCEGDVWWTGDLLLQQLKEKAILAFEASFPGCQGLWAFDNAKIHQKYAPDALQVGNMNLTPGGKNMVPIRDEYYIHPSDPHATYQQSMMLPDGRLKGLRIVLQERGLWPQQSKLLTQCTIPGNKPGERKPNPACKYAINANCCACGLLSSQPDFQAQKCQLQETLEAAGHQVIFYPVFHC